MDAQGHLQRAERLLAVAEAADYTNAGQWVAANIAAARAHIAMAHAIEAGVPHPADDWQGGASDDATTR